MAIPVESLLTIGQVAERAGLRTSHIRFYERVGVLPAPERVAGQRRYREEVLHRLSIIDVAQRAGLTLEEIRSLTGPENRSDDAGRQIRELADEKLPQIEALIARAQAVKHWLQVAQSCDCSSVDVCELFTEPTLLPPVDHTSLDVRQVQGVRSTGLRTAGRAGGPQPKRKPGFGSSKLRRR